MTAAQMDPLNLRILEKLAQEGRSTYTVLAKELRLTINTVRDRILAMERRGLILGYGAVFDEQMLGNRVRVLAMLRPTSEPRDTRLGSIEHPHIVRAHRASGPYGLVIELAAPNLEAVHEALETTVLEHGYRIDHFKRLGPSPIRDAREQTEEGEVAWVRHARRTGHRAAAGGILARVNPWKGVEASS